MKQDFTLLFTAVKYIGVSCINCKLLPLFCANASCKQASHFIFSICYFKLICSKSVAVDKRLRRHIGCDVASAIFTRITRVIIYFYQFQFSKSKQVSKQMKPCIPSQEWH